MSKVFFAVTLIFGIFTLGYSASAGDSPPDQFPGGTRGAGGRFAASLIMIE